MELLRPSVWGWGGTSNRDGAGASSAGPFTLRTPLGHSGRPAGSGPWTPLPSRHPQPFPSTFSPSDQVRWSVSACAGQPHGLGCPPASDRAIRLQPRAGRRWQGPRLPGTCRVDGEVAVLTWDRSVTVRPGGGQGRFAQGPGGGGDDEAARWGSQVRAPASLIREE